MASLIPETILVEGKKQVIMLDTKYSPYPQKDVRVENICGSFTNYVECRQFQGITRKNMGRCGKSCLCCGLEL